MKKVNRLHMTIYITAIVSMILSAICAFMSKFCELRIFTILAITFLTIFYHFFIRVFIAGVTYYPLKKLKNPDNVWFREKKSEKILYEIIRVRKWKKLAPTYNPKLFDHHFSSWNDIELETCRAECVHEIIVIFCFFPVFWSKWLGAFFVFL